MRRVPERTRREQVVLGALRRFGTAQGIGDPPLQEAVIEAFVVGLNERASSTRGTYRSVSRTLAGTAVTSRSTGFVGSAAEPPYTRSERTELWSMATAQPKAWRRDSALVVLALGIGAGLRASEITSCKSHWVSVGPGTSVRVHIEGARSRTIPVLGRSAAFLATCTQSGDEEYLFHPGNADRSYHNFVNGFLDKLVADPQAPKLSVARCRSSNICDHLRTGTDLSVVLAHTAIGEVESLLRYARHVESAPQTKAGLRHRLKAERR